MLQTTTAIDERMMALAIRLSKRGYPAPNPHVGCVIAHEEDVVGVGYHDHAGGPHAEIVALVMAGARAAGATVYVTLEPCNHHGRTPPCSEALIEAGVARVVVACRDPHDQAAGGLEKLRSHGIETSLGLLESGARHENRLWLTAMERGWPSVVVKAAVTLDGKIALLSGESKWITGERARKEAHRLRAQCGAVLVGRRTVEQDNPRLTVRAVKIARQPLRVVLDPQHRLTADRKVFDSSAPTLRVTAADPDQGDLVIPYENGRFDVDSLLRGLFAKGVTSVLVEGGGETIGSFFDARRVDRVELFVAPKVFGAGRPWIEDSRLGSVDLERRFNLDRVQRLGNDVWMSYSRIPA